MVFETPIQYPYACIEAQLEPWDYSCLRVYLYLLAILRLTIDDHTTGPQNVILFRYCL